MSDGDSTKSGAFPKPVTARLTNQTYEELERYAEEHTNGRVTVAAREVLTNSLNDDSPDSDGLSQADTLLLFGGLVGAAVLAGHFSAGGNPHTAVYVLALVLLGTGLYMKWFRG